MKVNRQTQTVGSTQGTGLPNVSMMPLKPTNANTSGPTPSGHLDNFNADNGAVGANAMATPSVNSGTTAGNALTQLYGTQDNTQRAYGNVMDPTLSGGQFPPGAPQVSGTENLLGPSIGNSSGNATADAVKRLDYINGLPWNTPNNMGASVNAPTQVMAGPAQPSTMPVLGSILQQLTNPQAAQSQKMRAAPQPPLNLSLTWPNGVGTGGLR